jgi:ABC-type uncharacterized transport system fused permease/ATPase subunit
MRMQISQPICNYTHYSVRTFVEQIAIYSGETRELAYCAAVFKTLYERLTAFIWARLVICFLQQALNVLSTVSPFL